MTIFYQDFEVDFPHLDPLRVIDQPNLALEDKLLIKTQLNSPWLPSLAQPIYSYICKVPFLTLQNVCNELTQIALPVPPSKSAVGTCATQC